MKIINLEQGSDAWKEYRRNCITASDFAVYMAHLGKCESLYGTSLATNLHHKITGKELADNIHFQRGREREIEVREHFNFTNMTNYQPLVVHLDDNPRIMASLDGYQNTIVPQIIELKNTSKSAERLNEIIDYTQWQIAHQTFISNAMKTTLLISNEDGIHEYGEVEANMTYGEWLQHCNDYLKLLDAAKAANGDVDVAMYIDLKLRIKNLENQLEPVKEKLIATYPDGLVSENLTLTKQITKKKDYAKYLDDHKITFDEKYIKTTESYVIRMKGV